jgi:cytochrome c oxidase subunit II
MTAPVDRMLSGSLELGQPAASALAHRTDVLMLAMVLLCGAVAAGVFGVIAWLCVRYRSSARIDRSPPRQPKALEVAWTVTPLAIFLVIFGWAAHDFIGLYAPPPGALPVTVVARQWMWKLQHRDGRREINELHVPEGQPVVLTMTSEDVIHSFYVPALRIKQDVVPGRYTRLWFTATIAGEFYLFCSEFCGSEHSRMIGRVVVMPPAEFGRWLARGDTQPGMAQYGFALFRQLGCSGCHDVRSTIHAPLLDGLAGRTVHLQDGRTVMADATYLRDSILTPAKDIVAGYAPVMPSFAGQVSEEDIQALIAYIASTARKDAP